MNFNKIQLKIGAFLVLMIILLMISLTTNNILNSKLSASFALITGAFAYQMLKNYNHENHD